MNDYDKAVDMMKALAVVQDRINDQSAIGNKTVKSFNVSLEKYLFVQYNDGSRMFIFDENRSDILSSSLYLSSIDILKLLVKKAEEHDIYLGKYGRIKILSKGETLENLAVEYDMKIL